jgi:hypothetical protein
MMDAEALTRMLSVRFRSINAQSLLCIIKLSPVIGGCLSLESGVLYLARPAFFAGLQESGLLMVAFCTDVIPLIFVYFIQRPV